MDTGKVAATVGAATVARADADPGPLGDRLPDRWRRSGRPPRTLTTVVDRHLASYDVLWAAAGTPHAVFPTTYDELVRLTGGTAADVAQDG